MKLKTCAIHVCLSLLTAYFRATTEISHPSTSEIESALYKKLHKALYDQLQLIFTFYQVISYYLKILHQPSTTLLQTTCEPTWRRHS